MEKFRVEAASAQSRPLNFFASRIGYVILFFSVVGLSAWFVWKREGTIKEREQNHQRYEYVGESKAPEPETTPQSPRGAGAPAPASRSAAAGAPVSASTGVPVGAPAGSPVSASAGASVSPSSTASPLNAPTNSVPSGEPLDPTRPLAKKVNLQLFLAFLHREKWSRLIEPAATSPSSAPDHHRAEGKVVVENLSQAVRDYQIEFFNTKAEHSAASDSRAWEINLMSAAGGESDMGVYLKAQVNSYASNKVGVSYQVESIFKQSRNSRSKEVSVSPGGAVLIGELVSKTEISQDEIAPLEALDSNLYQFLKGSYNMTNELILIIEPKIIEPKF